MTFGKEYIPLLLLAILIAVRKKILGDCLSIFIIIAVLIFETDIQAGIEHQCYKMILMFVCLVFLLCLIKHGRVSKPIAMGIVTLFFVFMIFVKKEYNLI